jgi:hypothetical protein
MIGIALCLAIALPNENSIVTSVNSFKSKAIVNSLFSALVQPSQAFPHIVTSLLPTIVYNLLIYITVTGLIGKPNLFLAALGAQIFLGVFFREFYQGFYRHQGLFIIYTIFLYWLFINSVEVASLSKIKQALFKMGLHLGLLIIILANLAQTKGTIIADIKRERSSSKAFGNFLKESKIYNNAILIPEPDFFIESLPYYVSNRIYLPREHTFTNLVSFTTKSNDSLSLGELFYISKKIKLKYDCPVLIVVGHFDLYFNNNYSTNLFGYNKLFYWNNDELVEFKNATRMIQEFRNAYGDENYRVFEVK